MSTKLKGRLPMQTSAGSRGRRCLMYTPEFEGRSQGYFQPTLLLRCGHSRSKAWVTSQGLPNRGCGYRQPGRALQIQIEESMFFVA